MAVYGKLKEMGAHTITLKCRELCSETVRQIHRWDRISSKINPYFSGGPPG